MKQYNPIFPVHSMIRKLLMLCAVVVILAIQLPNVSTASVLDALKEAAENGDVGAQLYLGLSYYRGEGVPKNVTEAARWFRMAAEQGFATAQFYLGNMYETGRGVPQNDTEAVRWYRMAAGQGLAKAQYKLGIMYDTGRGVPKNDTEAVRWYRMAAEQGEEREELMAKAKLHLCGPSHDRERGDPSYE